MAKQETRKGMPSAAPELGTGEWTIAFLIYERSERALVAGHRVGLPLLVELENWLREKDELAAGDRREPGFVAICCAVTGIWMRREADEFFTDSLAQIEDYIHPKIVAALGNQEDQPDPGKELPLCDVGGRLWIRLFYDFELDRIQQKVHRYQEYLSTVVKQAVSADPVSDQLTQEQHDHLRALSAHLPKDAPYDERAEKLARLNHDVRQYIAAELGPDLNARIQAMPHDTYEEKKELARWVNEELRRFDLAIKGPTGEPSILLVMPGHEPEIGRFVIEHKTREGKRVRPVTSTQLPYLELMEAKPRREALVELRHKMRKQGDVSRT